MSTRCTDATTTSCAGRCVSLASEAANCGSCGHACAVGQSCSNGACTAGDAGMLADGGPRLADAGHEAGPAGQPTCAPCSATLACASVLTCAYRMCDGLSLCFTASGSCVGSATGPVPLCPLHPDFAACSPPGELGAANECGTQSDCVRVSDFSFGCRHRCATAADCGSAPAGFTSRTQSCVAGHCQMPCNPSTPNDCPLDSGCSALDSICY